MKKLFVAGALLVTCLLAACGPRKDYGGCLSSHDEATPASMGYEYAPSGISMSGGIVTGGGGGGYRMVFHPGYTSTVCDAWEYPEGNGPNADR